MFVSNTSTLILLAKIGLLEKFLDNSPKVIIPEEVQSESMGTSFDALLIEKEIENKRILIGKSDKKKAAVLMAQFHLDIGEAAAFTLFDGEKHSGILTDDGELIKLCRFEDVSFICAMAIVVRMKEKNLISKQEAFDKLDKLFTIGRYSKVIYEHFKGGVK